MGLLYRLESSPTNSYIKRSWCQTPSTKKSPVRAGLVRNKENYRYSSAVDYYRARKVLIEIDRMS